MAEKPIKTSLPQEGISGWLNETGKLASLVSEEQRPQLITLVLIYIAFLILIPFSDLSDGIKVLMFVATSGIFLWLAFFVLPKQVQGIQSIQRLLEQAQEENNTLTNTNTELEGLVNESARSLSKSIADAHLYLETIEDKLSTVNKLTHDKEIKKQLLDLHYYVTVKKREFDSSVARLKGGGSMMETKKPAAASMAVGFFDEPEETNEVDFKEVSQGSST